MASTEFLPRFELERFSRSSDIQEKCSGECTIDLCNRLANINLQTVKHLTSVGAHPETPVYGLPEDPKTAIFRGVLDERIPCMWLPKAQMSPIADNLCR